MKVLITGATSGIGLSLVKLYKSLNYEIVAVGRNTQVLSELKQLGIDTMALDLSDLEECRNQFKLLAQRYDSIDLAILNAGNCEYVDCKNFDAELVKRVFDANVMTLANSIECILPLLRRSTQAHLVGIASMASYVPLSRAEAYGASKSAVNYLLESLAIDLLPENIAVTVVNPGFVKTPLTAKNDFPMPFALDVNDAAQIIYQGIVNKKNEIHFPYRLSIPMKIFAILPRVLWRKFAQKFKKV